KLALAQEFRMLSSLRHPHIISVINYGFDEEQLPYYTMDLLHNPSTLVEFARGLPLSAQIGLMVQVSQALAYLHRRGIIHRDLKPENVLVVDGTARVLDFGLAVQVSHMDQKLDDRLSGTLGYMAPEVLLGSPPGEKSDLYALGIMAYEIFYGEHPFDLSDPVRLIQYVIHTDIDLDGTLPPELRDIIEHLVDKDPANRYAGAGEVIAALARYINSPDIAETATIRDSYIQAANFVGREREMLRLESALNNVTHPTNLQGSAWLIGGESGVGKSRLVEEVRAMAMVSGALVLSGQAVDGGVQYQMWRDVARRLVLSSNLKDFELGVLREVVPDINALLEREIPEVPDVGERAGVQRLASAIETLFREQKRPVVLIAEDLHWADESIDILRLLLNEVDELPLMIVGTYRNEEMPQLPEILPNTETLTLERLTDREILELSVSILGESVGRQRNVLNLLERETEGNVFFLVEVVRVLAEEAGKLANIGAVTLPEAVFSGSMRTVIERRLRRLPIDALPMLRLAAVYGRTLDLHILKNIDPVMNFEKWLLLCSNAAILEAVGDSWRFAHDRMRDGILDVLDPSQRPKLNEMVADAIERTYPGDIDYALRLMRHWSAAEDPKQEAHYARIAAEQAFHISDYREALALFSRAAVITGADTPASVFVYQGEIHYRLGNFRAANASLNMALRRNPTRDEQTRVLSILGDVAADQGEYGKARDLLTEARQYIDPDTSEEVHARVLTSLGDVYWRMGNTAAASDCLYQADELVQEENDINMQLHILNHIATIALYRGDIADAEAVLEEAYFAAVSANHSERAMMLINSLGTLALHLKDYARAETRFLSAIDFADKLRLHQQMPFYLSNLAIARAQQGGTSSALHDLRQALSSALSSSLPPQTLHAVVGYAVLAHAHGDDHRATVLSGAVLLHPSCDYALRHDVRRYLTGWKIGVGAARASAQGKDFEAIAYSLLED
ncbi:MAG: protein kinase, partial [Chloroflexota bacterium]